MPVLPSYRNQLIDLLCESNDLFLFEGTQAFNVLRDQHLFMCLEILNDFNTFTLNQIF